MIHALAAGNTPPLLSGGGSCYYYVDSGGLSLAFTRLRFWTKHSSNYKIRIGGSGRVMKRGVKSSFRVGGGGRSNSGELFDGNSKER